LPEIKITPPPSALRNRIGLIAIPTAAFALVVLVDALPLLRGPDEWRWTLRPLAVSARLLLPIAILGLYTFVCARRLSSPDTPPAARRFLLFVTLAAPAIQLALAASVARAPLFEFFAPTVSEHASGYFSTAVATADLNALLADYPARMPDLPIHAQSHPPGPVMLHWLAWRLFQAAPALAEPIGLSLRALQCHNPALMTLDNPQIAGALPGLLTPLVGALAVWPLYAFGKKVVGARTALFAAAVFPVLPLFAMWPAQWDQLYPLLLFTSLYLVHTGLESRSAGRLFLAGVPLSIATFFSVGNFVLAALVGLYGLVWLMTNRQATKPQSNLGVLVPSWLIFFGLGCASIWLAYAVLYRVNPLDVISAGSRLAYASTTGSRSYGVWVVWNLIDFAIFFSVPLVVVLIHEATRIITKKNRPVHVDSQIAPLLIAALGSLLALNLSGIVRGEVGRLWMYFGPLLALIALKPMEQADRRSKAWVIGLIALQLFSLNARWLVSDSFLDEPPERQANFTAPDPQVTARAVFEHQIELLGYDVRSDSALLDLTLYWQALVQPLHAYTVFVHVSDADGQPIGQQDNMPVRAELPTSCWQPGEIVADPYTVPLPIDAPRPLALEVGLYRLDTGERLSLDGGSGTSLRVSLP